MHRNTYTKTFAFRFFYIGNVFPAHEEKLKVILKKKKKPWSHFLSYFKIQGLFEW